jgi:hypothetical protein
MAKKSTKLKRAAPTAPKPLLEVTPERLVHAANDTSVVDATIERAGQKAVQTREFKDRQIERMHRAGRISDIQLAAAEWYFERWTEARIEGRVTGNYNPAGGGEARCVGTKILGSEKAYLARKKWRDARAVIPDNMVTIVDMVVLGNQVPPFANSRHRERYAAHVGKALQPLAIYLGY